MGDIFSALVVTQEKLDVLRREIAVQINIQVESNFQIVFCCDTDGKENYLHILELDKHKRNHFLTIQLLARQNKVLGKKLSIVS